MDEDIQLRLKWRQTWPDRDADYVAEAAGYHHSVGRICQQTKPGSLESHWFLAMNAFGREISRNIEPFMGYEESPRKAARAVEEAWIKAIRGSSLDFEQAPTPAKNPYAAAKGRE